MPRLREQLRQARRRAREFRLALIRLALFSALLLSLWLGLKIAGVEISVDSIEEWGEELGTAGLIGFVPAVILLNSVFVLWIPVAAAGAGLLFGPVAGGALTI